ncbi:hypothetical protein GGR66_004231 [Xanthomonas sp. 3498]|nr:hypothetical protein [Xanthomonas sp. 3498]
MEERRRAWWYPQSEGQAATAARADSSNGAGGECKAGVRVWAMTVADAEPRTGFVSHRLRRD